MKKFLFSRDGRISRLQYWQAVVILLGLSLAASAVGFGLTQVPGAQVDPDGTVHLGSAASVAYAVLGLAYTVVMVWAGICVGAKRCHDRGRSAWFMLLMCLPLLNLWYLIEVAFLRGTPGPNPYGPDPLDAASPLAPVPAGA